MTKNADVNAPAAIRLTGESSRPLNALRVHSLVANKVPQAAKFP